MVVQKQNEVYSDKGYFIRRDDGVYFEKAAIPRGQGTKHTYTEVPYIEPTDAEVKAECAKRVCAEFGTEGLVIAVITEDSETVGKAKVRLTSLEAVVREELTRYSSGWLREHPVS